MRYFMRLAITSKLFIVIMGITALVIFAMGGAMSWSLSHSFNAFSEQQDNQRAQVVSTTLADLYAENKSWDFIRRDPGLWRDIVRPDAVLREPTPDQSESVNSASKQEWANLKADSTQERAQEHVQDAAHHNPQVASTRSDARKTDSKQPNAQQPGTKLSDAPQDQNFPHPRDYPQFHYFPPPDGTYPHDDRDPPNRRFIHWSLLDANGAVIAGNATLSEGTHRFPIMYGTQTVGWLAVSPRQRRVTPGEQHFLSQQRESSLLIMLGAAILAVLASLLLARLFLAPVRRLADATQQLIAGRYDTRVQVQQQDELGQLAKDFNHLALTLQRNEKLRRDFVADISHELRTPLAILKGELEAIQDGIRVPDTAAIISLQAETQALSQLVDDLYQLSLSDVGGLRYHMEEMDMTACLQHVVHMFDERFKIKGLSLTTSLPAQPIMLYADERRLTQLFKNLFENTLRYTDANGQVNLTLTQAGQSVQINLQDSAPGVQESELPKLFERLYRVESSRNRATGGAGLGLPLCQTIVEAHGGQIQAKHSPLGGVWIEIILPDGMAGQD